MGLRKIREKLGINPFKSLFGFPQLDSVNSEIAGNSKKLRKNKTFFSASLRSIIKFYVLILWTGMEKLWTILGTNEDIINLVQEQPIFN